MTSRARHYIRETQRARRREDRREFAGVVLAVCVLGGVCCALARLVALAVLAL